MKSITHRALSALVLGVLAFGATSAYAQSAERRSCCGGQTSCCSSECCKSSKAAKASNQMAERFRAKYGREYPVKTPVTQTTATDCCKHCC